MKYDNQTYVDISNIDVLPIACDVAKPIIVNKHYLHKWTSCRYSYGIYNKNFLIGCIVYGPPVGRQTVNSITKSIKLDKDKVMELTRLWIADGYGTNIESYSIGQSFKYLKKEGIEVLISYADPEAGHLGKIYQATNWLYQGNKTMLVKGYNYVINGVKMHPRNVVSRYGSTKDDVLYSIDPNFSKKEMINKHRYIYILNSRIKNGILNDLKHPILEYPK